MTTNKLLTQEERKAIIERLVQHDEEKYKFTKKEQKRIRKIYSKWDDAKLMSVRFN